MQLVAAKTRIPRAVTISHLWRQLIERKLIAIADYILYSIFYTLLS